MEATSLNIHWRRFSRDLSALGYPGGSLVRGVKMMVAPDFNSDTGVGPGREYPGTPRWVKVFGIIVIVLVLLVAIIIFIGGHTSPVQHGP